MSITVELWSDNYLLEMLNLLSKRLNIKIVT
jgi:hypothetical protein